MINLRKRLAVVPLALALGVAGSPTMAGAEDAVTPAAVQSGESTLAAAHGEVNPCPTQESSAEPASEMTLVDGQRARDLTDAAIEAQRSGEISVHAPQSALSLDQAKAYAVNTEDGAYTSVTIPVGGEYSMVSNLTVLFDGNGDLVQYGETLISRNDAGNFNITSFMDGELVNSNDTDRPYMTDAEMQESVTTMAWGTAGCVAAVLGVSGAFAYLIVGACTGACAVPAAGTAVCVACIGAYASLGGVSITQVAGCFR